MGNAQALVVNKTHRRICVITFNQADLLYNGYHSLYILEPAETKEVQALSNPIGLKVAIVYDAIPDGPYLKYQRWTVKNGSSLTITDMAGESIATYGEGTALDAKGQVKEKDEANFSRAVDALTYQSPVERSTLRR